MKDFKKILLLTLLFSCITACSSLLESEQAPERVYLLKPYLSSSNNIEPLQKTISVTVSATPGLDTNKILILEPDAHLNHYASARWADYSTEVLASLIRNTLESSGTYLRVVAEPSHKSDELSLEIKELYTLNNSENNAESVLITLDGYLECNNLNVNNIIPIKLHATVNVKQNRLSEIVDAYQMAIDEVSKDLLTQLVGVCK